MDTNRPIIIRKKVVHGSHHGGAWKVAYADFVTAMMALFIVLWMLSASKQIQEAVAGYFRDPTGAAGKATGNGPGGFGNRPGERQLNVFRSTTSVTRENVEQLKEDLEKSIKKLADFEKFKNQIEITVTEEGLRIELMESDQGTFFDVGSTNPTPNGRELLVDLAQELGNLPNRITIEGHTDAKPFYSARDYGNWELSAGRANTSRRLMQENGLRDDQVSQVRGYADQLLHNKSNPFNSSNRRVSLIVEYLEKNKPPSATGATSATPLKKP